MSTLTTVLAILVALEHLYIMFLETIATNSRSTSRVFGISIDQLKSKTIAMKEEMQEAFQHGFQSYNKEDNKWQVLPDKDFYQSLEAEGAEAYEAIDTDGQRVGGAIIAIESLHPETEVWETCTPYFDRRNIHFYINRLGFHAVEFFNEHHPDPHMPELFDQEDGLFKFEKCV